MKQLIIAGCMLLFAGYASAQSTGNSKGTTHHSTSKVVKNHAVKKTGKKSKVVAKKPLNQRKEYEWKNGQEATPTGHEATGINGGYSAMKKDTVTKTPVRKHDQ